jgi:Nucleotidyl transferase AbiEii toxin, Type IV TA system
MTKPILNMAASVHQKLLNKGKTTNRSFNELLHYYAMERFLYRLSRSKYSEKFILKGALLFTVWDVPASRSTKDIDLLGKIKNDPDGIASVIKEICAQSVEDDGLRFESSTVKTERIVVDADYKGVRANFTCFLNKSRVPMQIDIGFGDPVLPGPVPVDYPTILDFPAPHLHGYRRENSIAEKFNAMCTRGMRNSRMKDFYDIWLLCRLFDFDGAELSKAIESTFQSRHFPVPAEPLALEPTFTEDKNKIAYWKGFLQKIKIKNTPQDLKTVCGVLKKFLGPVAETLAAGKPFHDKWKAPGPWKGTKK